MQRAALLALILPVAACSGSSTAADGAGTPARVASAEPVTAKVTAFAVSNENLNVDVIGMRDGGTRPDGNRDLAFTATVEGPVDALYIVRCSEKGEPLQGFRADTIAGHEELPPELGSVVDVGRLTVWIAVVLDGKFVNAERTSLGTLPAGTHALKLYVPNTGNLAPGSHVRMYARAPGGAIVAGPVIPY